jgi:hypothetical protein
MITISDHEMLKALGYVEDYQREYSDSVEATVQLFKKRPHQSVSY